MFIKRLAPTLFVFGVLSALIAPGSAQPDNGAKGKQPELNKKAEPDEFFKRMVNFRQSATASKTTPDHFLMSDITAPFDAMDPLFQLLLEQKTPANAKITLEKYLLCKEQVAARWGELKLGEKRAGEHTIHGHRTPFGMVQADGAQVLHYCEDLPVSLKAGQNIVIQATVVGEGRSVALQLIDPADQRFKASSSPRDCNLVIREVNATGKYRLRVTSSHIGPFHVTVFERTADIKALEARIEQLERELAESRAKLQELLPRK